LQLESVEQNYDRAARSYDRWSRWIFDRLLGLDRWRARTIARLGDLKGKRVLDIGCGTGINLPLLVDAVGPSGSVIGIDYSEGMLARARARVEAAGWTNVTLLRGDAAALEGVPDPVDAVLSTWVLGIVHDLPGVLSRATDLLAPGGRLAVLDFDRAAPDNAAVRLAFPLIHRVMLEMGIDDPEDLDDDRQRARWRNGKELLRERLDEVEEERYLAVGFLMSGTKPGARGARTTLSTFNHGTGGNPGMGAGGQMRSRASDRVDSEWFYDLLTTDLDGLAHRLDSPSAETCIGTSPSSAGRAPSETTTPAFWASATTSGKTASIPGSGSSPASR